jgi:hypothetical protein
MDAKGIAQLFLGLGPSETLANQAAKELAKGSTQGNQPITHLKTTR